MDCKKLICVGDGGSGKTCLLISFIHNKFEMEYVPTCLDHNEIIVWKDGMHHRLSMWDTAGGEDYDRLRPLSYPQTDAFIITFSCVSPASFENVRAKWFPEISHHCPNVPFFIVATKLDLRDDPATIERLAERNQQPVSQAQGMALAEELGGRYFETSALTGKGVRTLFETAAVISDLPLLPRNKYRGMYTNNEYKDRNKRCCIS